MIVLVTSIVVTISLMTLIVYGSKYLQSVNAIDGFTEYQNGMLELRFQYPSNWGKPIVVDDESCYKYSKSCAVSFNLLPTSNATAGQNYILGVRVNKLNPPSNSDEYNSCSCNTLQDFVKWDYTKTYKNNIVLNDNQTTIGGNKSGWQMEVLNNDDGYKTFVTWIINGNQGYRFLYSAPDGNDFGIFLSDFKKLLNSVNFVTANTPSTLLTQSGKSPSFLLSNDKESEGNRSDNLVSKTPSFLSNSQNNNSNLSSETHSSDTAPLINEDNNIPLQTFTDEDFGISLNYPFDWTFDKNTSEHYTIAHFVSPDNEATVDIRVFPKGDYKSLRDYGNKEFKESDDITLLQYYRNSTTLLGGKPALKAIYLTTTNPGLFGQALGYVSSTSKAMMVATDVPEKKSIVAVAYFADSNNFAKYLPSVNQFIASFQIGDKSPIIQEED